MLNLKRYILVFLLICLTNFVQAQTVYRFKNYTINEGLSQSSVTCVLQDEHYSLWIGTQDGLNRFDGKSFEIFNSDLTPGIESDYIRCGIETKDGKLWFGTSNGLTNYDPETESFKTHKIGPNVNLQVEKMAVDQYQQLWLSTVGYGLVTFDPSKSKYNLHSNLIPSKKIQSLDFDDKGRLIVSTEDNGVFISDERHQQVKKILFKQDANVTPIITFVKVIQNQIFIGTNQGIYLLDENDNVANLVFQDINKEYGLLSYADILQLEDKTWLLATSSEGLITLLPDGKNFISKQDIFQKNALLFNEINTLFEDAYGNIWIGSERGISSFDAKHQGFLGVGPSGNHENGIPTQTIWCFAEDAKGTKLYVGTDKGISCYDRQKRIFYQFYLDEKVLKVLGTNESIILTIQYINDKKLLVGTTEGLLELSINNPKDYHYKKINCFTSKEEELRHNRVYKILHYKHQQYFLTTKSGVVLYDLKTNKSTVFEHRSDKKSETISYGVCRFVFKDLKGRFFFTTSAGGLNILVDNNGSLKIKPYNLNNRILSLTKDYITSAVQTSENEFWFGTLGSGLIKWNEGKNIAELFTKKEGLPNNVIYGVLQDGITDLWLSTNRGLCKFNRFTNETVNYTENDGLMSNEFNLGAYLKSKNGELYFGGIYGYNFFNPKTLSIYGNNVSVILTRFKFDKDWLTPYDKNSPIKEQISKLSELNLSYRQRSFTIKFQATDISNPELINYKYLLEGSDEGYVLLGNNNELRFSSLSPGTYHLKIYARIGEGAWGKPAVIDIHIGYPFWAQWWFILIVVLFIGLLVRIIIRNRIESVRIEQVRLELKVAERTSEIRAQNEKIEKQKQELEKEKNKVVEQQKLLQIEKDKSEKLLKNIIPESTAEELKSKGRASARAYKTVSVIFTDFVGFTKIAEKMTPSELVNKLDIYFRKFDEIIVANNLEKIKTIGDAYMCAGGVPVRNNTNPIDACLAALQIQDYMEKLKFDALANDKDFWELRLGINTGEVTAGVIGSERLAYDIWGATVNQAQRMEMLGEKGKVTITGATFKHIEPYFVCTFRGKAQSKSKGLIEMYTVDRIKPELSVNGEGVYPNERFHQIVNLHHYSSINYYKAERHIIKVLENGLSDKLHYHSISHTKDVVNAVERIALSEGVTDEGLFLLKSAATYHDAGFVEQYEKNEPIGARMAEEILPKYGYTEQHINRIKELIYVTQIPHQPKDKMEEIICDADLDYLGRDDFHEIADRLRRELKEHGKIDSDRKWDQMQVSFLNMHKYFTETSINTRQAKKEENLAEILARIERDEYMD